LIQLQDSMKLVIINSFCHSTEVIIKSAIYQAVGEKFLYSRGLQKVPFVI